MGQVTGQTEVSNTKHENHTAQRIIGSLFGIIEIILAFRLVFKLLGASSTNGFVQGLYDITQPFVGIFESIFAQKSISTTETVGVFEPETLVAMVIIALIALILLKLIKPRSGDHFKRTEYTENKN